jgi:hypothetical protein
MQHHQGICALTSGERLSHPRQVLVLLPTTIPKLEVEISVPERGPLVG